MSGAGDEILGSLEPAVVSGHGCTAPGERLQSLCHSLQWNCMSEIHLNHVRVPHMLLPATCAHHNSSLLFSLSGAKLTLLFKTFAPVGTREKEVHALLKSYTVFNVSSKIKVLRSFIESTKSVFRISVLCSLTFFLLHKFVLNTDSLFSFSVPYLHKYELI